MQRGDHAARGAPTPNSTPSVARGQSGFTLIEMVVAVAIVSTVILGLAGGFLTMVRTNADAKEQQLLDHAVSNYAESLTSLQYEPCSAGRSEPDYVASTDLWTPGGSSDLDGLEIGIDDIDYWNPGGAGYVENCPGTDRGAQRLTIKAEWGDRSRMAQIVKRVR